MVASLTAQVFFGESSAAAEGVKDVQIMEAEYTHERAVILVDGAARTSKRFASGAPVSILWGRPPGPAAWFVGYVNHSEPMHEPLGDERRRGPRLRVVCVGVTWVSKDQQTRTFRHVAPVHAVSRIAKEMRLDTKRIAPPGSPAAVLHQHGMSDWEFMVDCAKKAGLTLFTRGTALFCEDRRALITDSAATAPVLVRKASVTEFHPHRGAAAPGGGEAAIRSANVLNFRSGNVSRSTVASHDRPLFTGRQISPVKSKAQTRTPFSSIGEAREHLAAEARVNSLGLTATLVGAVDPRCRVGKAVWVSGFGEDADGLWYVMEGVHEISDNRMTLTLGRDTEQPYVSARPTALSTAPGARGARLLGGTRWVAA